MLLAWGRSHRTSTDGELIRWGTDLARIEGHLGAGRRRGGDRPLRGRWHGRPQAPPGERRRPPGRRAREPAAGRRLRPRGDAAGRRLAGTPARRDRPARELGLPGLRQRALDVRPDAPAAQRPAAGDPRGRRVARRAPVLGRGPPRRGRTDRRRPAAPPGATGRPARRGPRRDRPRGGGRGRAGGALQHECAGRARRDATRRPGPPPRGDRRQGGLERGDARRPAPRRPGLRAGRARPGGLRVARPAADGDPRRSSSPSSTC